MASYVTVPEAMTYFQTRLYTAEWIAAGQSEKAAALAMAQKAVDRQPLRGRPATTTQTDAFPRAYADTSTRGALTDVLVTEVAVPQEVKDAVCEEALAILKRGDSERVKLQAQGVVSIRNGDMSETYAARHGLLSAEARELLRPWLLGSVGMLP